MPPVAEIGYRDRLVVLLAGLVTTQAAPAQAATYYNSRCGNTSGRVLLTFDDWAYGDPY